jgi:hypothetical protein
MACHPESSTRLLSSASGTSIPPLISANTPEPELGQGNNSTANSHAADIGPTPELEVVKPKRKRKMKNVVCVRGTPAHPIQTHLTHLPDQTHLSRSPNRTRLTCSFTWPLTPLMSAPLAPSPQLHSPPAYTSCLTTGPAGLPAEPSDLRSLTLII